MSYQKKYYYTFVKLKSTEVHTVEIWHNTEDVIVAEEIQGHMNPFTVEMPELDHKFQVVRGSGCVLNLLSDTDMKFFTSLYHVDPTEFMVKHYIGELLNFVGYLNAEMITEPYDIDFNYQISLTGNDGFSLMDRFSFLQSDGTNYEGILSKWDLIQIIFTKIGLPYYGINVSLSTTFAAFSGAAGSTILHESYVNCANFYDEDKKPMSLREVMESILAPYGAYIRLDQGYIYITDINILAQGGNITYKQFANFLGTYSYSGQITIDNEKTISEIGYKGTGTQIEMSGGVNRQVVEYSPYPVKNIIDESIVGLGEFTGIPAIFNTKDNYYYRTLTGNTYWSLNPVASFEQSYYNDFNDGNIYIRWPRLGIPYVNQKIAELIVNPYLNLSKPEYGNPDDLYRMLNFQIRCEILTKTKDNPYDSDESYGVVTQIITYWSIKIGDKYFDNTLFASPRWTTTPVLCRLATSNGGLNILDNFIQFDFLADVDTDLNGNIEIEIWSDYEIYGDGGGLLSDKVKEIWVKNIELNLKRIYDKEIPDSDISFIGLLDKMFQNEGEKIRLTCGTDAVLCDRGKIMKLDGTVYSDILEWTRNSQTFKIEELLLASLSSNYRSGFITLSNVKLKSGFSLQNVITDTFIGTKKLMVKSANINYHEDMIECSLVEVTPDELIIVKDPTIF